MEVPDEVLRKLLCENCENYLSRGPVLMLGSGRNRCGRCVEPEETVLHNAVYEELAKLMTFPCRYKENGCEEKVTFETNLKHEESCGFRQYNCPILEAGKCIWSGIPEDLLEHCKLRHPDCVLKNPVKFSHNFTASSLVNYLITVFNLLFLVQVKVCMATRKIYHAVRLVGNSNSATKYRYDVIIENNGTEIRKNDNVLSQGCRTLQEDTSIAVGIDSLLAVLGNFQNTLFTITVRAKDEIEGTAEKISVMEMLTFDSRVCSEYEKSADFEELVVEEHASMVNTETSSRAIEIVKCVTCQCMREPVLREGLGWECRICSMTKIICRHCSTLKEIHGKCQKHEMFFCSSNKWCIKCRKSVHSFVLHPIKIFTNQFLTYTFSFSWRYELLNMGKDSRKVLCSYWLGDFDFAIYIFLDAPSNVLHKFDCMVEIEHPKGGSPIQQKLDVHYDRIWDWRLRIPRSEFSSYAVDNKFTMKISVVEQ